MRSVSSARTTRLRVGALCGLMAAGAFALGVTGAARGDGNDHRRDGIAVAVLHNASGAAIGTARLHARPGGVLRVRVDVSGLTPGFHGFHVHAVGRCEPPFTSAGGHAQAPGQSHGAHAGDMPPLLVLRDGTARMSFEMDGLTLQELFDGDGSALIVHDGRDNLANIPARYHSHVPDATSSTFGPDAATLATGDAGTRAACGVIARPGHSPRRRHGHGRGHGKGHGRGH